MHCTIIAPGWSICFPREDFEAGHVEGDRALNDTRFAVDLDGSGGDAGHVHIAIDGCGREECEESVVFFQFGDNLMHSNVEEFLGEASECFPGALHFLRGPGFDHHAGDCRCGGLMHGDDVVALNVSGEMGEDDHPAAVEFEEAAAEGLGRDRVAEPGHVGDR